MKSQVIDLLKSSAKDIRSYSSVLTVERLMPRNDPRGAEPFRLTNVETDTPITTMDEFMLAVTADNTRVEPYNQGMRNYASVAQLLLVTSDNVKLTLDQYCKEDQQLINTGGLGVNRVSFILGYVNDADEAQPLKILGTILTEV